MAYRKLLLPVIGTEAGEAALATAFLAARIWKAHVHGLHVRIDPRDVAPLAGEGLSGAMIEEMMSATERESAERAKGVQALFSRYVEEHGIPIVTDPAAAFTAGSVTASFGSVVGREEDVVAQQARLSDVVVLAHPEAGDDVSTSDALHAVLFDSGRPVMVAPRSAPGQLGRRVCIGWNGTAESAAAVAGGLPWIERAESVTVLHAEEYQRRGPDVTGLVDYLAWHGVKAQTRQFKPVSNSVGAGLLAAAKEAEADLLIMGAYSHSRLRQLILGGVTRHVLEHADLTLLMSR
ncbi:universal stress protein [Elioraea sp. Yellowstone]|jgi:nucleotide-binding universal stress UspA family protein|uniref:universal stress protein n=1 Tax=Elioraea sp. Yellowstone TaxID=2592070 RepID=UPI001153A60B|nr:universal stress protein [Elioraea sp. Yellowstone]TQF83454.1 universal stress protein [Elioraea sp. Yellowstone]